MEVILSGLVLIYVAYWIVMSYYFLKKNGVEASKNFNQDEDTCFCSIVICARNEEKHIGKCLESIICQEEIEKYGEIILVNDASEDNTVIVAEGILSRQKIPYKIIHNPAGIGKKKSIEKAVSSARPESKYILFRDADTYTTNHQWFKAILSYLKNDADLLIAPVIHTNRPDHCYSFLSKVIFHFQYYEGLALMHLTLSSLNLKRPILCNGANMAVKRHTFQKNNPYADNYHIQTGDDIFLLNKIKSERGTIISAFEKSCVVYTYPPQSINDLLKQKIRWLSKTTANSDLFNAASAVIIAFGNVSLAVLSFSSLKVFAICLFFKVLIDWTCIDLVQKRLKIGSRPSFYFFIAELLYIPYVCALILNYSFKQIKNDGRTDTNRI
ncbi:MAG: glycosyltransferase [Bacteroidia bacterium]